MSYREPGVIITQEKNTSSNGSVGAFLPIVIVGSGSTTINKVHKVVKTSADYNFIEDEDGDKVTISSIVRIGNTLNSTDYNIAGHTADFSLDSEVIDSISVDVIRWNSVGGEETPAEGDTYYVEIEEIPADKHYELKTMTSASQVKAEYGPDVNSLGEINNITLATLIALENVSMVYTIKAAKSGATITPAELQVALDALKGYADPYRIINADDPNAALNLATVNHVRLMSDPDEQRERVTLIASEHTSSTAGDVITNVGGYAEALGEFRAAVFYPDKAKRTLSDGNKYILPGQFIAVALASLKSRLNPEESYTGKQIGNFDELVGVRMTKSEKNLLAAKGVMILDQERPGFPVEIRHGLSTDMSSLQMREISVTELADYVSRVLRPVLKQYKGKKINASLLVQMDGSVSSALNSMIRSGHINAGSKVVDLFQIEGSEDTVAVSVRVNVPYPCNYIDVVVAYE